MNIIAEVEKQHYKVFLTEGSLNLIDGVDFVRSLKCGAIHTFSGTIRDSDVSSIVGQNESTYETILAIHYEAYEPMVLRQVCDIIQKTISAYDKSNASSCADPDSRAFVGIRLGRVLVGDTSIVICVSSKSRHFSHQATISILNDIKSEVAIWKKIIFSNKHEEWVDGAKSEASWLK